MNKPPFLISWKLNSTCCLILPAEVVHSTQGGGQRTLDVHEGGNSTLAEAFQTKHGGPHRYCWNFYVICQVQSFGGSELAFLELGFASCCLAYLMFVNWYPQLYLSCFLKSKGYPLFKKKKKIVHQQLLECKLRIKIGVDSTEKRLDQVWDTKCCLQSTKVTLLDGRCGYLCDAIITHINCSFSKLS